MSTIADLLDPADRQRLERLGKPEDAQDPAAAARDSAVASTGPGRTAWSIVALALDHSGGSAETARGIIDAIVHDDRIRHVAQACLTTLASDGDTTTETT
jgi:hypothetical protein